MALDHPTLVAITPQTPNQNNSFIKNITSRSSFCGTPTVTEKSFISNRKSWNGTLPLQVSNAVFHEDVESPMEIGDVPTLATFKSGTGTFPRKNAAYQREASRFSYRVPSDQRKTLNNTFNGGKFSPNNNTEFSTSVSEKCASEEVSTPNGNIGVGSGDAGNEARSRNGGAGNGHGRRYAEIGNWSSRSSSFLEPHIQGVGWRTAPESDRGQEDHSTEDDEQFLIKDSRTPHSFKKPSILQRGNQSPDRDKNITEQQKNYNPAFDLKQATKNDNDRNFDIEDNSNRSNEINEVDGRNFGFELKEEDKSRAERLREKFELKQASKKDEVDGRPSGSEKLKSFRGELFGGVQGIVKKDEGSGSGVVNSELEKDHFRPIPAGNYRDSLSQSRESLSSRTSLGSDGDCECDSESTSGSGDGPSGNTPCDIGLVERLVRTHPVWFLPGIQRAGAFHLLQGKEEGNFVVRQSSQTDTMALSVRLPARVGPYIEHYLIHASAGRIGLETSQNKFDNIPDLVAHYSQCCDELPVQLTLPRALREAKNRQQLSSLALLGQEFWRYPMANPRQINGAEKPTQQCTPMSQTPSDTGSSFGSLSVSAGPQQTSHSALTPSADQAANIMLNLSSADSASGAQGSTCNMSTFKGSSPPMARDGTRGSGVIRAPRPTPPNTLNLVSSTAHITHHLPTPSPVALPRTQPPPPPPRWAKTPFPNEIQTFTPVLGGKPHSDKITVTATVTFSVDGNSGDQNLAIENLGDNEVASPNNDSFKSDGSINVNSHSFSSEHHQSNGVANCQNSSKRLSPDGECVTNLSSSQNSSLRRRKNTEPSTSEILSPRSQTTFSPDPILNSFSQKSGVFSPTGNQILSPNGSNSATSGIFSPSQINSPLSNATISSKSGVFSPLSQVASPAMNKSELFSPLSRSSPISGKSSVFSPVSNQSSFNNNSAFNSPLIGKDRERVLSPNTNTVSSTPSGRSRRSKHSHRKESRHYQESDILESPGVYYRSSVGDKVSDYEDIWGPEQSSCSSFRPRGSGMLVSKRPDLLPDTLPKVTSLNSNILSPSSPTTTDNDSDKEHHQLMASKMAAQQKIALHCLIQSPSDQQVNMIIATTNSKGEAVAKRPDKLNLLKNANEQMDSNNDRLKDRSQEFAVITRTDDEIERDNLNKNLSNDECSLLTSDFCSADDELQSEKQGSPFYADPVDALKEVVGPLVQRRRIPKVGVSPVGAAQRYSEPPSHAHPYLPLRDMHSIEELSPSSPNTSSSVDNLSIIKSGRPRGKAVLPPRIKPTPIKQDQTWTVDSSWEFINKQASLSAAQETLKDDGSVKNTGAGGAFPSLAEQQSRLDAAATPAGDTLTIHQVLAQRFPELNLSPYPTLLRSVGESDSAPDPSEDGKGCRMSSYDNVEARLANSSQMSDDGTVFSEPWDCSHWDSLLPPSHDEPVSIQSSQTYDMDDDGSSTMRESSMTPPIGEPPVRLATISRAKSFRDRLDPLLAPPRLQALRGCRGSGSSGSGGGAPGSGVRAYALHLAADKTTTFAQNVDNFIACTIESKETCPHIVMRNMRQFMSGMKNYLVKHGEREFEKEVEKERLKLKSNEFLNLDAILEGVLHGAVVAPLRGHVYRLLADRFAKRGDVALLTAGMRVARTLPALRLGVRPSVRVPSEAEMVVISKYFVKMQEADSPLDKLENLLSAISAIFNAMKAGGGGSTGGGPPLGADDFLPVLVLTLSRCAVAGAELEAELMAGLLPPPLLAGEGGYYLTTLFGAVAVLKRLASPEQDKTLDWRSGSLGSRSMGAGACAGVARVLVPDESAGALRCVALPWRPGARARDLCRALAHRARITNPQDYGLFALRDGEETLLGDGDCPQDLIGDQKSTNCMLAYKRIDAKIAWPKHALQSYP